MINAVGVLQNDPNCGLRGRIEPGHVSAVESLDRALVDLQELVRVRMDAPPEEHKGRRSKSHR